MGTRICAVVAYVAFLGAFSDFVFFSAGVLVPKTVDSGVAAPLASGLLVDLGLVAFFGVVHSVLARRRAKALLGALVPAGAVRSVYVLVASLQLALVCALWRPLPGTIWATTGAAAIGVGAVQALGWGLALGSTFLVDHLELFGLRQGLGLAALPPTLRTPLAYRLVRHPRYLGLLVGMWAAPVLSTGHLVLAATFTAYALIGIRHEERDLVRTHGDAYRAYRERVPMLIPSLRRRPLQ